jgi:hypothetical protein
VQNSTELDAIPPNPTIKPTGGLVNRIKRINFLVGEIQRRNIKTFDAMAHLVDAELRKQGYSTRTITDYVLAVKGILAIPDQPVNKHRKRK